MDGIQANETGNNENQLLTRKQVSKILNLSPESVDDLLRQDKFKYFRPTSKRAIRISKESLDEFIRNGLKSH